MSTRGTKLERLIAAEVALASRTSPKNAARGLANAMVRLLWNAVFLVCGLGVEYRGLWATVMVDLHKAYVRYKAAISKIMRTVFQRYEGLKKWD